MPRTKSNHLTLAYDTFGDPGNPPILLIMGLGAQMILWEEEFCEQLAADRHRVIRFDNRDVGESTRLDDAGVPDVAAALLTGAPIEAPYSLDDMADDTVGLLDALGISSAHFCGASMGGMIAQTVAIRHPQRARSLTSIMSTTGNPELPQARPEAAGALLAPPPQSREDYIEHAVDLWRTLSGSGFAYDEESVRRRSERVWDRGYHPAGTARQLAAIIAHGDRRDRLAGVDLPALVIHGDDDPLVPVEGGYDTHRAIAGAALMIVPGMGHDLPRQAWPQIIGAIRAHVERAEDRRAA